jgi:hypothetical protein
MIRKHSASRPAALFAIGLMLVKRLRLLLLNRPHVSAHSPDARR